MFTGKRFNPNPTQGVKRSYEDHKDQDGPKDIEQHERAAKQAKSQASSGPMNTTSKLPPQRPDSPPQHPYVLYQWDGSGYDFVAHKKFYPAAYYKYHANDNNDANHNEAGDKSGAQQSSPAAEKKTETEVYDMDSPGANCLLKLDAPASPAPANADAVVEEYDVEEYDAEEYDVEEYDVEEYDVEEYDVEEHDVVDVADVPGSDVDVLTELEGPDIAEEPVREQIANGAAYDEEDKENQDVVDDGDAENYYEDDSDDGECDMSSCLVCGI
ncbi:hypothetical protein F5B22DRAFT_605287 [Xylaria bambusicola]|uniref:uncharacterized protein n=1 Tax=Xylaria bambusicola TaxID=326684 RepID=UPI002007EE2F|nr:uncharacterized protein F5B22DRAFT_605287 [Xylaria bambusicola]KAI0517200.1 hypothetical protein F5B22DRAFT_605287 [Xylaria bambusicola]